jgi:hypothetical protein
MFTNGPGTPNLSPPLQREAASSETVKPHTRKSQIIEEEDDDIEEDIEEVDTFSDPGVTDTSFMANEPAIEPDEDGDETIVFAPAEENNEETKTLEDVPQEASLEKASELLSYIPPRTSSLKDPEVLQLQTDEAVEEQPALETESEPAPVAETAEDVKTIIPEEETEPSNQHDESKSDTAATDDVSDQPTPTTT